MRIVTGFLFLRQGEKLLSIPMPLLAQIPVFVIRVADLIELIGGMRAMIGLFTGFAAFLCHGLMVFACRMVLSSISGRILLCSLERTRFL